MPRNYSRYSKNKKENEELNNEEVITEGQMNKPEVVNEEETEVQETSDEVVNEEVNTNDNNIVEEIVNDVVEEVITEGQMNKPEVVNEEETEVQETSDEVVNEEVKVKGIVTCAKLNIREQPDINSKAIHIIENGVEIGIDLSNSTDDFYKVITIDNIEGYCMKNFIQLID